MKKLILIAALIIILTGCTQSNTTTKTDYDSQLKQNNYQSDFTDDATEKNIAESETVESIDYTKAPSNVGEYKTVKGKVDNVYYSKKSDTTFINFCPDYKTCPFCAVVFSSDKPKFGKLSSYKGKTVEITGLIKSYQGRTEIILNSPSQIKIVD